MQSQLNYIPKGIYRDQLLKNTGGLFDYGWKSNVVVDQCRQLLAAFIKGDSSAGIQYLAIGTGNPAWDASPQSTPSTTTFQLADSSPFIVSTSDSNVSIDFLDSADEITSQTTNRVQFTVTLGPGQPPPPGSDASYPLREFALFGQIGSSDFMIDYVRHAVINKGVDDTLTRTIRLAF